MHRTCTKLCGPLAQITDFSVGLRGRMLPVCIRFASYSSRSRFDRNHDRRSTFEERVEAKNVEGYVGKLHIKYKIRSDARQKYEYNKDVRKERFRPPASVTDSISSSSAVRGPWIRSDPAERTTRVDPSEHEAIFSQIEDADRQGTAMPSRDLVRYAAALSQAGHVRGVETCQKIMAEHDEDAFDASIHLDHYLANAMWVTGKFGESTKIFKRIFYEYPLMRKKIKDVFRFCIVRSLAHYPCDGEMGYIKDFVAASVELREYQILVLLWAALFSHAVPAANEEAHRLVEQYPQIPPLLHFQFPSILQHARKRQDTSTMLRFLQFLPSLPLATADAHHWSGCIIDALMDVYCIIEDLEGATEVMRIATEQAKTTDGLIWPETVFKLEQLQAKKKARMEPSVIKIAREPVRRGKPIKLQF